MKAKAPNYLYPLATDRQLQWTKDVVKGEASAKSPIRAKTFSAPKKQAIKVILKKGNLPKFGKPQKTRALVHPWIQSTMPEDPMSAPDPRPGNAMHINNTMLGYKGYNG